MPKLSRRMKWAVFLLLALLFYLFVLRTDPKVSALNDVIAQRGSSALQHYPYPFHVVRVEGDTAYLSTPRSPDVPVVSVIGTIEPKLAGASDNDPDFMAAQARMARVQGEARALVLSQPGIKHVEWELDRSWLLDHGVMLPPSQP